jgi:hypothetical protein
MRPAHFKRTIWAVHKLTQLGGRELAFVLSPASEASREVKNFDWRKNTHPSVYGVKEFVTLSVCYEIRPQLSLDWLNRIG